MKKENEWEDFCRDHFGMSESDFEREVIDEALEYAKREGKGKKEKPEAKPKQATDEVEEHIRRYGAQSGGGITCTQLARILTEHGIDTGRTRLYELLEKSGVIERAGDGYTMKNPFGAEGYGRDECVDLQEYGLNDTRVERWRWRPVLTEKGAILAYRIVKKAVKGGKEWNG